MVLDIEGIKEGVTKFILKAPPDEFELAYRDTKFEDEIKAEFTVIRHEKKLVVGVSATTTVKLICSRCLSEFQHQIEAEFDFGVELSESAAENVDLWEEDFVRVSVHNGMVNINRRLRDAILLELPMRPLCMEECKGLCPGCGVNLNLEQCKCKPQNTDNPFYKLKEMLERKEKNGSSKTETFKHENKKKKNPLEN